MPDTGPESWVWVLLSQENAHISCASKQWGVQGSGRDLAAGSQVSEGWEVLLTG